MRIRIFYPLYTILRVVLDPFSKDQWTILLPLWAFFIKKTRFCELLMQLHEFFPPAIVCFVILQRVVNSTRSILSQY